MAGWRSSRVILRRGFALQCFHSYITNSGEVRQAETPFASFNAANLLEIHSTLVILNFCACMYIVDILFHVPCVTVDYYNKRTDFVICSSHGSVAYEGSAFSPSFIAALDENNDINTLNVQLLDSKSMCVVIHISIHLL